MVVLQLVLINSCVTGVLVPTTFIFLCNFCTKPQNSRLSPKLHTQCILQCIMGITGDPKVKSIPKALCSYACTTCKIETIHRLIIFQLHSHMGYGTPIWYSSIYVFRKHLSHLGNVFCLVCIAQWSHRNSKKEKSSMNHQGSCYHPKDDENILNSFENFDRGLFFKREVATFYTEL